MGDVWCLLYDLCPQKRAMYGVYYMTCVPRNDTDAYTFVIRRDVEAPEKCTVYTYGFVGNMTMARPVRPVKETN